MSWDFNELQVGAAGGSWRIAMALGHSATGSSRGAANSSALVTALTFEYAVVDWVVSIVHARGAMRCVGCGTRR